MDNETNYYQDGVTRVLALLKETLGSGYTYFDDEVLQVPGTMLPCVMVFEGTGGVRAGATGTDDIGETITIVVALNLNDELGATELTDLVGARLRRIIKGQNPTTGEWLQGTVLHALRTNFTLGNASVANEVEIDFSPNQRGDDIFTKEAYITLRIERMAMVPNRT
jgi:hypothetical protein